MARPPKASVRYYLPRERADKDGQTKLRGVASYAKKRLSFTLTLESWELLQVFTAINPDGTLREDTAIIYQDQDFNDPENPYYGLKDLSDSLVFFRSIVLELIERAIKKGVWERMTTADLNMFLNFISYHFGNKESNEIEKKALFKRGGIFETWCKQTR